MESVCVSNERRQELWQGMTQPDLSVCGLVFDQLKHFTNNVVKQDLLVVQFGFPQFKIGQR